jgi:hypothetical protein
MTTAHLLPDRTPAGRGDQARPADPASGTRAAPIIVLTYAHSGTEQLRSLLARHQDLACTSGTGILPLCDQTAATWRSAEGRGRAPLSALATTSTRSLAAAIITTLLAREGKRRWCEVSTTAPGAAETFLRLFPGTRILCLHRSCPGVIHAALRASSWGLAGSLYTPFISAHPVSTVAALTSYWVAHTAPLIAFEQSHPEACQRVRYEDLAAGPHAGLLAFLGLDNTQPGSPGSAATDGADSRSPADDPDAPIPVEQIPLALLAQANDLLQQLGYPPMAP